MKRVLIPWSGGVDSTYLIYKNLKEGNEVGRLASYLITIPIKGIERLNPVIF